MPELPEVEHARRRWARLAYGRRLVAVSLPDPSTLRRTLSSRPSDADPDAPPALQSRVGAVFEAPIRHGKRLGIPLSDGWVLLCHLGMTGRWIRRESGEHGRVGLHVDDGWTWWFEDPRRFGALVLRSASDGLAHGLGPDALDHPWTGPELAAAFSGCRSPIKVALLDQARIAGVGNIQAVEALWYAGISPYTLASNLLPDDWARLVTAIRWTLERTLADAGDEELVYLSQDKSQESPFLVYGRGGEPCRRCGAALQVASIAGRTTTWCADCQRGRDREASAG